MISSESIKQTTGMQLTFIFKIKLQKEFVLEKFDHFISHRFVHFKPMVDWECVQVCHYLRSEKENNYGEQPGYKTSNRYGTEIHFGN